MTLGSAAKRAGQISAILGVLILVCGGSAKFGSSQGVNSTRLQALEEGQKDAKIRDDNESAARIGADKNVLDAIADVKTSVLKRLDDHDAKDERKTEVRLRYDLKILEIVTEMAKRRG